MNNRIVIIAYISLVIIGIGYSQIVNQVMVNREVNQFLQEKVSTPEFIYQIDNTSIILMIGDGMGSEHINLARLVEVGVEGSLNIDELMYINNLTTFNSNGAITDSAAAATTLATGVKTINGHIGFDSCKRQLESILEAAQNLNKSTGLVTTTEIIHATPAAFATHVVSRNNYTGIAQQLVDEAHVDVLLGGGQAFVTYDQISSFQTMNYDIVYDLAELQLVSRNKMVGLFALSHLPYVQERDPSYTPSLPQMTQSALNALASDPDGFFLMIEGGLIDHASHAHNKFDTALETIEFDQAIKIAKNYVDEHSNTLLLVTADHETGGLTIIGDTLNSSLPGIGLTQTENLTLRQARVENISITWTTDGHTMTPVPLYIYGPSLDEFPYDLKNTTMDNKDVYPIMRSFYPLTPTNPNDMGPCVPSFPSGTMSNPPSDAYTSSSDQSGISSSTTPKNIVFFTLRVLVGSMISLVVYFKLKKRRI
ncbi:MAG: alkaline phosphatase [Candidatus Hodarchaeota archaeon]